MNILAVVTALAALVLSVWALVRAIRRLSASGRQVIAAGVVEVLILLTVIFAIVAQGSGHVTGDPLVLWGYLIVAIFVLPVAVIWAFVDRSPTSSIAMLVCGLTVAVMMLRVVQVAALV
ncbi:MAG TPA: hypothetical protein VFC82_08570 [Actinomycetaceae bacterium]|nr:hypothetical protein [Actinomycetaceae bacterium]